MKKEKNGSLGVIPGLVVLLMLLGWLWEECEGVLEYLFIRTPPSLIKFRRLWETNPEFFLYLFAFLFVLVITLVLFFAMIGGKAKRNHNCIGDRPLCNPAD